MKKEYGIGHLQHHEASIVTVGTFDGVHRGHQAILRYLNERARERGGESVVVSFDPHPREVVRGEPVPLLTTIDERADVLEGLGLDRFIVLDFTPELRRMPATDFVETILVEQVGLREIVIGYDHGFGHGREGDSHLLLELGKRLGFTVDVIPPQLVEEHVVSSTAIRHRLVEDGDVAGAADLLGRYYSLRGKVVEGDRRGRTIGYPTANLAVDHPRKIVPRRGVYAVRVTTEDGARHGGMMNIGRRPTFNGTTLRVEVHLFDLDRDLYGQVLRTEFVERIREERPFDGVEALIKQLNADEARCRSLLGSVS